MHPPVPPIRLISSAGTGPLSSVPQLVSALKPVNRYSAEDVHLCVPGLGPAPVAKMEAMNIQSKSGPGGSRAVPPKSPAG